MEVYVYHVQAMVASIVQMLLHVHSVHNNTTLTVGYVKDVLLLLLVVRNVLLQLYALNVIPIII